MNKQEIEIFDYLIKQTISEGMWSLEWSYDEFINALENDDAEMYCRSRLVSFVGSDAHRTNHRPPRMSSGINRLSEICVEKYVKEICFENSSVLM